MTLIGSKGPIRELLPVGAQEITIKIPAGASVKDVKLLVSGENPNYDLSDRYMKLTIPHILDHEVVAVDLG